MIRNQSYTTTIALPPSDIEIDVEVLFDFRPGCAAQTYGPPEHCFPAEPAEVEINKICGVASGLDILSVISDDAREVIEIEIQENIEDWMPEPAGPDYDY